MAEVGSFYSELTSRNSPFISQELQQKMRDARLCFIGCGLASQVAVACARLGFSKFRLWDGDCVDASNLNRQAFRSEHIGQNKAFATGSLITEINPECEVELHPVRLELDGIDIAVRDTEIVVNSADFDDVVYEANRRASELGAFTLQPLNLGFGGCCLVFGPGSASLESMTNGRQQNASAFLMNLAQTAEGLDLSNAFAEDIPMTLAHSASAGFFPQNMMATNITTALLCLAMLRVLDGRLDGLLAPRVLNFDPLRLFEGP